MYICYQYRVQKDFFEGPDDVMKFYTPAQMDGNFWIFSTFQVGQKSKPTEYCFPIAAWKIKAK